MSNDKFTKEEYDKLMNKTIIDIVIKIIKILTCLLDILYLFFIGLLFCKRVKLVNDEKTLELLLLIISFLINLWYIIDFKKTDVYKEGRFLDNIKPCKSLILGLSYLFSNLVILIEIQEIKKASSFLFMVLGLLYIMCLMKSIAYIIKLAHKNVSIFFYLSILVIMFKNLNLEKFSITIGIFAFLWELFNKEFLDYVISDGKIQLDENKIINDKIFSIYFIASLFISILISDFCKTNYRKITILQNKPEFLNRITVRVIILGLMIILYAVLEKYLFFEFKNRVIERYKKEEKEPIQVTAFGCYGKRFVKVNEQDDKLEGAEFIVRNANVGDNNGKYLALKGLDITHGEGKALIIAKENYTKAIETWNNAVAKNNKKEAKKKVEDDKLSVKITVKSVDGKIKRTKETLTGKTAAKKRIAELKDSYFKAFEKVANEYEWVVNKDVANVVKLISDVDGKFEIKGLDKGTYKIVEVKAPVGYALPSNNEFEFIAEAECSKDDGLEKSGFKNCESENQSSPNPQDPEVIIYGKKFVKMEEESGIIRHQGAKFVIKNAEGKFLASTAGQAEIEKTAYETAQKAYIETSNAYNQEVAKENPTNLEGLKATLAEKKKDRDDKFTAYVKAQNKWVEKQTDALEFTSDEEGRFKVEGLEAGTYTLVETQKSKGYVARTDEIRFTVGQGTYAGKNADGTAPADVRHIQYNKVNTDDGYGLRVDNKKVTIQQTCGSGSVIFIVAGLAIMGGAFIAYRRTQVTA